MKILKGFPGPAPVFTFVLIFSLWLTAQEPGTRTIDPGRPYLQNYDAKTYGAHQENWSITQDNRGIMYIGNQWGLLAFDGTTWQLIKSPKNAAALSVDCDDNDRAWIGFENDFGYLSVNALGERHFVSLLDSLPEDQRKINQIWKVHALEDGVYFLSIDKLFYFNGDSLASISIRICALSVEIRNKLVYGEYGSGIIRVVDGQKSVLPGSEIFAEEENYIPLAYGGQDSLLLVTKDRGLFLYTGAEIINFSSPNNEWLKAAYPYCGLHMPNGNYVIGTIRSGALVMSPDGEKITILDRNSGLRDQTIVLPYLDREGSLWLALTNGLSRVEINSPFARYDGSNGLESSVLSLYRFDNLLYAGTQLGLFYLDPAADQQEDGLAKAFKPVSGISTYVYVLHEADGKLLAGTDHGTFVVNGTTARRVEAQWPRVYDFHRAIKKPERIYVALLNGLSIMLKEKGHWEHHRRVQQVDEEIVSVTGDDSDVLWLGTPANGILRVEIEEPSAANGNFIVGKSQRFGEAQGLPAGGIKAKRIGDQIFFATAEGLFQLVSDYPPVFRKHPAHESALPAIVDINVIAENDTNKLWLAGHAGKKPLRGFISTAATGKIQFTEEPFLRISDLGTISAIFPENPVGGRQHAWFGGSEGLVRYTEQPQETTGSGFATLIRGVLANGDSLIAAPDAATFALQSPLSYRDNALRFEYTATSFLAPAETGFQYQLQGFDDDWSAWTKESRKDYTNLQEGEYRFVVRSRNIVSQYGSEASVDFRILPPLYRSWWAILLYIIAGLAAIALFTRSQTRRLQRKADETLQREKERARLQEAMLQAEALEAQQEVEKVRIRSRIAGDLHDEIGSNLSSISVISQMLQQKSRIETQEKERLVNIQEIAQQTANSMRDIVWFINPVNDRLDRLFAKMRETANILLEELNFRFEVDDTDWPEETDLNFRRNLYLIYKESLQNIIKHSRAETVTIHLKLRNAVFELKIKDDGAGFTEKKNVSSSGLHNLRKRAEYIGGTLTIDSKTDQGTQITLKVSLGKMIGGKENTAGAV